ncbi:hypothetical protein AB0559_004623 [Vibrio parahaemolyticus]|uniref:hypothetical protein n=1 Tax=Vibrio parahaemolyticus TaxID=670 RepID=UPI001123EFE8|nr:hypothetical protein [Vibrio parahaemolyticus]EJG0880343.1 hypothetical protein [Vibrio parahaemolyticus]MBE4187060.1 hypothetical protein [Vibrio parahaemolyticus]MDF4602766.1 hypothetical protein [Vibrio parahaemolyticus]MDF4633251.1 hypothetical protein [Vibrio parahaemolyticus]TOJ27853.1 hypothetical protein CGI41_23065 [Vibrio parahaemolyticus]
MKNIKITEVCTILIALLAMVATFIQANISEEHNRRTVVPYLMFELSSDREDGTAFVSIKNDGLGPAIITGIDFNVDGKIVSQLNEISWEKLDKTINEKLKVTIQHPDVSYKEVKGKLVIAAGESVEIMSVPSEKLNSDNQAVVEEIFDFLSPSLCYRSIYGDKYFLRSSSSNNDDFGSCNYKGAIEVFGTYYRFYAPWKKVITHEEVFGS